MSTNDVPGAKSHNNDELAMGCWAEHKDGSMIFIKGVENKNVIFDMYDLDVDPPLCYSTSMFQDAFEEKFSWKPDDDNGIRWTWHDKTPMPWQRVMKSVRDGQMYADAQDQLNAASKLAKSMDLKGTKLTEDEISKLVNKMRRHHRDMEELKQTIQTRKTPRTILQRIQGAISELKRTHD